MVLLNFDPLFQHIQRSETNSSHFLPEQNILANRTTKLQQNEPFQFLQLVQQNGRWMDQNNNCMAIKKTKRINKKMNLTSN
jgi:hypothetical protein